MLSAENLPQATYTQNRVKQNKNSGQNMFYIHWIVILGHQNTTNISVLLSVKIA